MDDNQELERFLTDELSRISISIRGATVQAAYGSILVDSPQLGVAGVVAIKIDQWNNFTPPQPNRITIGAGEDSMVVLESGVYQAQATVTATIRSGRQYAMTMAINDVLSPVFATVDASNQTTNITLVLMGMQSLTRGDEISVYVAANIDDSQFDIQSAAFELFRISELHQVFQ